MVTGEIGVLGDLVQKHVDLVQDQGTGHVTNLHQRMEGCNVVDLDMHKKPAVPVVIDNS